MSQLMQCRLRDNGCQSFWQCLAAEVCRIVCCVPALPVALVVILMLSVGVGRAQTPIAYETTPRDTLGETLWTIDVSGPMTPSLDGTKFLVVNSADAMFYVVDVATGSHRKIASAPRVVNAGGSNFVTTIYDSDSDMRWLWVYQNKAIPGQVATTSHESSLVDLAADTIVHRIDSAGIMSTAISSRHRRLMDNRSLVELPSMRIIATYDDAPATHWFDDAHGLLYRSRNVGVDEYDAVTGRFIRSHGPFWNAEATVARRAPGSPWLYVVTTRMRDGYAPYVVAIHTETKEQRYFDAFAGSRQSLLDPTTRPYWLGLSDNRLLLGMAAGNKPILTWVIDADQAHSRAHLDVGFPSGGERKWWMNYFVPADAERFIHAEHSIGDSGPKVTRHRRLVPRASVSVAGDTGLVIPSWFRQWPDRIAVVMPAGTVDECVIVGSDGREAVRVPQGRLQASPIELPTLGLASGMYICRVRTAGEWRSQSFMVVK